VKSSDDLVPRDAARPFLFEVVEPAVEFGLLGTGQRYALGSVAEAVPEVLDELQAFRRAQFRDVESRRSMKFVSS
jgi:hypothetical protein